MSLFVNSAFLALFLLIISGKSPGVLQESSIALDSIIVTVNGEPISYEQIAPREGRLETLFRLEVGRQPIPNKDDQKIAAIRTAYEMKRLTSAIQRLIRDQERRKYGIVASESEIDVEKPKIIKEVGYDDAAFQSELAQISALIKALKAVQSGAGEEETYTTFLEDWFTYDVWIGQKNELASRDAIRLLEENFEKLRRGGSEGVNWRPSAEANVVSNKMNAEIDSMLFEQDEEFRKFRLLLDSGDIEEINAFQSAHPFFVEGKRATWWNQRYKETEIVILEARFNAVTEAVSTGLKSNEKREANRE